MNTSKADPRIVILGAGPAGVGAAFRLTSQGYRQVTVLEQNSVVGGNAGSFAVAGMRVDYGSHRLHPSCAPEVFKDIKKFLGEDLVERPRHGRIRLHGRWIHFPLKPLDLLLKISPHFAAGVGLDMVKKGWSRFGRMARRETFATVLEAGLGGTICRDFYFPYAKKLWGVEPEELAVTQAKRRVGANSLWKMVRKILTAVPGLKPPGAGRFFYPKSGFGQISEALYEAAVEQGAQFHFKARVKALQGSRTRIQSVHFERDGVESQLPCDQVWSTLPVTALVQGLHPSPPAEVLRAKTSLSFRAMILIYLVLEQDRFTEFDAHYFPEGEIPISRLSEPKNYSQVGPTDITVLCAELPCSSEDRVWTMTDEELGEVVRTSLSRAGIPIQTSIKEVVIKRLRHAYPIYRQGYEEHFQALDDYVSHITNLVSFGRQGLFAHDNTHHALSMAYSAVGCLTDSGAFDRERWAECRKVFETHVVED